MTTARDFLDYPDDMMSEYEREECFYDDDLSYDSTDVSGRTIKSSRIFSYLYSFKTLNVYISGRYMYVRGYSVHLR